MNKIDFITTHTVLAMCERNLAAKPFALSLLPMICSELLGLLEVQD